MIHQYVPRNTGEVEFELCMPDDYVPIPLPGRDDWIEALRSGRYSQTRGSLIDAQGYCCLGVACKVMGLFGDGARGFYKADGCTLATKSLPTGCSMQRVIGTHGSFPDHIYVRMRSGMQNHTGLTNLNDKADLNFHQIAWVIERIWSQP